eukprot:TRINITY_DN2205_c0_g1_i1.p2 TRINITY_DN2205_c0_g1~~TRINITY_DN2205_c0_g1_i1.p2  ORF type:complete len:407 (-),score=148.20 TRINITY_DN2205_c0_g1_i1:38-1258(-)
MLVQARKWTKKHDPRAPKLEENVKCALFLRGKMCNATVSALQAELSMLKKPYVFKTPGHFAIHPFDDDSKLDEMSRRKDASLICFGTSSKRHPESLVFARMYDHHVLDMIELVVKNVRLMSEIRRSMKQEEQEEQEEPEEQEKEQKKEQEKQEKKQEKKQKKQEKEGKRPDDAVQYDTSDSEGDEEESEPEGPVPNERVPPHRVGLKPCFAFAGAEFEQQEEYAKLKNMLIDFYRGEVVDQLNLANLEELISVVATPEGGRFTTYRILLKQSSNNIPVVVLREVGPRFDFEIHRHQFASATLAAEASRTASAPTKAPKRPLVGVEGPTALREAEQQRETLAKRRRTAKKNVSRNAFGETVGRVYTAPQDLDKLRRQIKLPKALRVGKKKPTEPQGADAEKADAGKQ